MKKIILLFVLVFTFQSCFRIHKARRIDSYKLYDSRLKNGAISYGFHLNASRISFYPKARRFFQIEKDYLPEPFKTKILYPKEELEVSFYLSSDQDKKIDLFTAIFNYVIGFEDAIESDHISKDGDDVYNYVYVKVKDLQGKDVFSEDDDRRKAVLKKLNDFRYYLN
ncbi:hypothetical protein [Mesonia aestuariivivens]|uniref:Lipoprotein n=1 Tax=Mesonia aestuariivivens TaxID=2796128 RepID=A0ABS6W1D8_9FLAO|nr:hypothetical protein [Mesonia aestuariivivens]MBW2961549.1 hypothetical protein [Mesonia aestuariivivens]